MQFVSTTSWSSFVPPLPGNMFRQVFSQQLLYQFHPHFLLLRATDIVNHDFTVGNTTLSVELFEFILSQTRHFLHFLDISPFC